MTAHRAPHRSSSWPRHLAFWSMLLPFFVLSLLAPGVMPARAADGQVVLVLCTPDGPQEMALDLGSGSTDHRKDGRCDWAQAMPGAALLDAPLTLPLIALTTLPIVAPEPAGIRPGHDPRGIFARGPPSNL